MDQTATFSFRARDQTGQMVSGTMAASSASEVGARLRAEGKFAVSIDSRAGRDEAIVFDEGIVRRSAAARNVRREDVVSFCEQLSVMLDTGVPLTEAIDAFTQRPGRRDFATVLEQVRSQITAGEPFSAAIMRWPRVFPRIMTSLVRASEASGTLGMMLGRVGRYLRKERQTARQIRGALAYPAFMMTAAVGLSTFLMVFVLPRFATIYETRKATLPGPTRVLLAISNFLTQYWMYYVPSVAAIVIGLFVAQRRPFGRRCLDWLRLSVPLIGRLYRQLYLTRSARTMATLLSSGVGLLDVIQICRAITANCIFDRLWDDMEDQVRNGRQMSDAFAGSPFVPANITSMVVAGERSGKLPDVMERIADFTEQEMEATVKQVTAFIEPIMVMAMGVIVGAVAIALLLPIFRMSTVVAH